MKTEKSLYQVGDTTKMIEGFLFYQICFLLDDTGDINATITIASRPDDMKGLLYDWHSENQPNYLSLRYSRQSEMLCCPYKKSDPGVCLVTVDSRQYYIFRHEGPLNGQDNVVVVLSHPRDVFVRGKLYVTFFPSILP